MPAVSKAQQQTAGIALAAKKKGTTKGLKEPAKSMAKMSKSELEKFASTKHKGLKKHVTESITMQQEEGMIPSHEHPGCDDKVGAIHVVLKPGPDSQPKDIMHSTHAFGMGQFDPSTVHGIYSDEEEAGRIAEAACSQMYESLKALEEKKMLVTEKISKAISKLQKQLNMHLKAADENPEHADEHQQKAEQIMMQIKKLRHNHKAVEESKKELPVKDEE